MAAHSVTGCSLRPQSWLSALLVLSRTPWRVLPLQAVGMWLTSVCATAASSSSSSSCTRRSSWTWERRSLGCPRSPSSASTSVFPFVCRPGGHNLVAPGSPWSAGKARHDMCSPAANCGSARGSPRLQGMAGHKAVKTTVAAAWRSTAVWRRRAWPCQHQQRHHFAGCPATVPLCRG